MTAALRRQRKLISAGSRKSDMQRDSNLTGSLQLVFSIFTQYTSPNIKLDTRVINARRNCYERGNVTPALMFFGLPDISACCSLTFKWIWLNRSIYQSDVLSRAQDGLSQPGMLFAYTVHTHKDSLTQTYKIQSQRWHGL